MSSGRPLRYSIRGRAALLTSVLVAVALATFTWLTVARVRADLIKRGIERAETTAATLATQTAQSTQQGLTRLSEVASGPAVLSFLREPNDHTKAAVLAAAAARNPSTTAPQEETVAIWDGEGHLLLDAPADAKAPRTLPGADKPPVAVGVSPLLTHGDVLFARSVV